jgi:hypothetical protein
VRVHALKLNGSSGVVASWLRFSVMWTRTVSLSPRARTQDEETRDLVLVASSQLPALGSVAIPNPACNYPGFLVGANPK